MQRLAPAGLADALLGRLAPARVIVLRVDVRVEPVLVRRVLVPRRRRLLVDERDLHDRLDALEAVLPRHDELAPARRPAAAAPGRRARSRAARAGASPRRGAGPRRTATSSTPVFWFGMRVGSSSVSNATYFALPMRLDRVEQLRRARSRPTARPSTTPRRSGCDRRAPRAARASRMSSRSNTRGLWHSPPTSTFQPSVLKLGRRGRDAVLVRRELVEVVVVGDLDARASAPRRRPCSSALGQPRRASRRLFSTTSTPLSFRYSSPVPTRPRGHHAPRRNVAAVEVHARRRDLASWNPVSHAPPSALRIFLCPVTRREGLRRPSTRGPLRASRNITSCATRRRGARRPS